MGLGSHQLRSGLTYVTVNAPSNAWHLITCNIFQGQPHGPLDPIIFSRLVVSVHRPMGGGGKGAGGGGGKRDDSCIMIIIQ